MLYPLSYGSVTSLYQSCSKLSRGLDSEQRDTLMICLIIGSVRAPLASKATALF